MGSALGRRDAGKAISICGGERERKGVTCQKDTKRKREINRRIENETDRQAGRRYKLANIQSDKEGDKKEERHINKFTMTLNIQKGSDTKRRSQRRAAPAEGRRAPGAATGADSGDPSITPLAFLGARPPRRPLRYTVT